MSLNRVGANNFNIGIIICYMVGVCRFYYWIFFNENKNRMKIDQSWDGGIKGYEILIEFIKEARNFLNLRKTHYIYYISSSRTNLDELNKNIYELGFKNEIVEKNHIFFEDIVLNRVKTL